MQILSFTTTTTKILSTGTVVQTASNMQTCENSFIYLSTIFSSQTVEPSSADRERGDAFTRQKTPKLQNYDTRARSFICTFFLSDDNGGVRIGRWERTVINERTKSRTFRFPSPCCAVNARVPFRFRSIRLSYPSPSLVNRHRRPVAATSIGLQSLHEPPVESEVRNERIAAGPPPIPRPDRSALRRVIATASYCVDLGGV